LIYVDTDFFLAIIKESDWLKTSAERLLHEHAGEIWTSSAVLIELLILAEKLHLDPEKTLVDAFEIAHIRGGGEPCTFLAAAVYMKEGGVRVFDVLHAAFCSRDSQIISSDKVFNRLGLRRIPLEQEPGHSDEEAVGEGGK